MGEPKLVLIAEDDVDNREGYAEYLTYLGYRVAQAADGQEALDAVRRVPPDVILLDLALPQVDGWEVARQVKADPALHHILVIALSACVFPDDVRRAETSGCDLFLDKPCYPQTVADAIGRLLDEREAAHAVAPGERRGQRRSAAARTPASEPPSSDTSPS